MEAKASLTLRTVTSEDGGFLERVYALARAEELAVTDWTDQQKAEFCRAQFAAQDAHYRMHYPTAEYFIVARDGASVGRLYVDRWEKEIRIMDLALLPQHRGAGIGTKLLRDLQAEADAAGKVLSIHVEQFNPALGLYERLGFRKREERGVYFLMDWRGGSNPG
jgi:ribosomal protein S18 acetylase RimI-like enzyme